MNLALLVETTKKSNIPLVIGKKASDLVGQIIVDGGHASVQLKRGVKFDPLKRRYGPIQHPKSNTCSYIAINVALLLAANCKTRDVMYFAVKYLKRLHKLILFRARSR